MAQLTYNEFQRQVGEGRIDLPPVVAFAGDGDFLRMQAIATLRQYLDTNGFTVERFDDAERSGDDLVRSLRTSSLFGERLAIVVRSQRIGNRQEIVARFREQLLDYLDGPSKNNVLVIDGKTFNGSMSVPKRIKADHLVVDCPAFKPWQTAEIESLIATRAQVHGLKLASGVASDLRDVCSADLALIERELEKLALVVDDRPVTRDDLAQHLKYHGEADAFALCDAVIDGAPQRALALATKVVRSDDPGPILQFLGLLGSQVQKVGKLTFSLGPGTSPATALARAGFNPRSPRSSVLVRRAQALHPGAIQDALRLLLDTDRKLKSGAPDPVASVLSTIAALCEVFRAPTANASKL